MVCFNAHITFFTDQLMIKFNYCFLVTCTLFSTYNFIFWFVFGKLLLLGIRNAFQPFGSIWLDCSASGLVSLLTFSEMGCNVADEIWIAFWCWELIVLGLIVANKVVAVDAAVLSLLLLAKITLVKGTIEGLDGTNGKWERCERWCMLRWWWLWWWLAKADAFNNDLLLVDEINDGCGEDDEDDNGNDWDEEKENDFTGDWCNSLGATGNGCDDNIGCSGIGGDVWWQCTTTPWNGTNIKEMLAISINHDWYNITVGPDINKKTFDHLLL